MKNAPKMPSMKHLPWSQEDARQQKWLTETDLDQMLFTKHQTVMTEKMDGSNCCITEDNVYARSHSAETQKDQFNLLKRDHRRGINDRQPLRYKLSQLGRDYAVYGEWLYARHSIKYKNLPNPPFLVFGVLDLNREKWVSWARTELVANELGLETVPVIRIDNWDRQEFEEQPTGTSKYGETREGYVLRTIREFSHDNFTKAMAKCVRHNHVQTEELHWRKGNTIETNDLQNR